MIAHLTRLAEFLGAAALLVVVAVVFTAVSLRYLFNYALPDSYDLSRLILGILIFWGIAAATLRGTMITADFLYESLSPRLRRVLNVLASSVTACILALLAWRFLAGTFDIARTGNVTQDLRLPVWIFYSLAAPALLLAAGAAALCAWRGIRADPVDPKEAADHQ